MSGEYVRQKPAEIAVLMSDVNKWGCPSCGYRSGSMPIQMGGTGVWRCGECGESCFVLADGLEETSFGIDDQGTTVIPMRGSELDASIKRFKRVAHPREGTPSHGRPDQRPPQGGEYFGSRGPGVDRAPGCFVCPRAENPPTKREDMEMFHNIAAFVVTKEAGERVVAMFGRGAWLDYRERTPDRIQVKVGACETHLRNLEALHSVTSRAEGVLTDEFIRIVREVQTAEPLQ